MSNHNYSKYSNNKKYHGNTETNPSEVKMEVERLETIEPVETVELPKIVKGTVVDCMKLNVRAKPSTTADVLCVVNVNSEMEIDVSKSNNEWLHVNTAAGVDGYCMRKFVNAKL